jgi:exopolysaccharide production protein ExoQ
MIQRADMSPGIAPPEDGLTSNASSSALSFAVGFYFAFRPFIVLLAVRMLRMDPQTGTGINLAFNFALLVVAAFCCLGQRVYPFGRMLQTASVRWTLLFLGFSCFSLSWSDTASIYVSIAYWCGMAADFAIVALMLRARSVIAVAAGLMKGYVWGGCVGAAIAWILPSQSDLRLGDEELLGPNSIGYICAIALLFAQLLMRKKERGFVAPAFLLALTVLRCLSKTTIVALLLCEALLLTTDASMKRRTKVLLTVVAALVIVAFSSLLTSYFDIYTNAGNQSETLSGRLGIWAYFVTEAYQKPWFGHGFDSVWKVVPPFGPEQFEAPHAHNELLQQFYAYGVIGICIFGGIYTSLYRQIRRREAGPTRHFFFAFLLFVLVRGLAESERFDLSLPLWAVLIVSALVEDEPGVRDQSSALAGFEQPRGGGYRASQPMISEAWQSDYLD